MLHLQPQYALDYLQVADQLRILRASTGYRASHILAILDSLECKLNILSFSTACFKTDLLNVHRQALSHTPSAAVGQPQASNLAISIDAIAAQVNQEASKRVLLVRELSPVGDRLRGLQAHFKDLSQSQQLLLDETCLCLETGAYRAAMVMAWNLVFDRFRFWISSDPKRLGNFNQHSHKKVTRYEDFFGLKEWNVIGAAEKAALIGEVIANDLRHHLRQRNNYAHPSFTQATISKASAYIEQLLDIITKPIFES